MNLINSDYTGYDQYNFFSSNSNEVEIVCADTCRIFVDVGCFLNDYTGYDLVAID